MEGGVWGGGEGPPKGGIPLKGVGGEPPVSPQVDKPFLLFLSTTFPDLQICRNDYLSDCSIPFDLVY